MKRSLAILSAAVVLLLSGPVFAGEGEARTLPGYALGNSASFEWLDAMLPWTDRYMNAADRKTSRWTPGDLIGRNNRGRWERDWRNSPQNRLGRSEWADRIFGRDSWSGYGRDFGRLFRSYRGRVRPMFPRSMNQLDRIERTGQPEN